MAEEVFGEANHQRKHGSKCNARVRRGNRYAAYTRKFSLGNGPVDLVQEYLITKEGGKMLGTLVALAVARMRALETFVWDMPTGVIRDVWLALASLADRDDGQGCRLEKVWVRWHENSQLGVAGTFPPPPPPIGLHAVPVPLSVPPPPPPLPAATTSGHPNQPNAISSSSNYHNITSAPTCDRVEQPTFSVLPPLKSLSVVDIDELAYLDEMSILIGKSVNMLKVLRVGIAQHAQQRNWVTPWEGEGAQQVDYNSHSASSSKIGDKRLGGVLGVLVGRVHDVRQQDSVRQAATNSTRQDLKESAEPTLAGDTLQSSPVGTSTEQDPSTYSADDPSWLPDQTLGNARCDEGDEIFTDASMYSGASGVPSGIETLNCSKRENSKKSIADVHGESYSKSKPRNFNQRLQYNKQLQLETLELERVSLSVSILQKAFDWSTITNLSLFGCANHEQLWRLLRRKFSPSDDMRAGASSRTNKTSTQPKDYKLKIQKIHTDMVSPALLSFLKETLAPNSLEVLFLQESRAYQSTVTIDNIFRGPIKRHRSSLKKLLINSSDKSSLGQGNSIRWRKWMLNREVLTFITSGRMSNLRELGISLEYRDWVCKCHFCYFHIMNVFLLRLFPSKHYFLQRLPLVPHIRSLYIPHVADHIRGSNNDPRELALQIVDIVALRPEINICYMGISNKCFEILESSKSQAVDGSTDGTSSDGTAAVDLAGGNGADGLGGAGTIVAGGAGGTVHAIVPQPSTTQEAVLVEDDEEGDGDGGDDDDDDDDENDDDDSDDDGGDDNDLDGGGAGDASDDAWPDENDDDMNDSDEEAFYNEEDSRMPRLRLREILFYDDKVAVFKARHGTI